MIKKHKQNIFETLVSATKKVLGNKKYKIAFALLSLLLFLTYILLPIKLIAGNTLQIQLGLLNLDDYLLFVALSLVTSLLLVMQVYLYRNKKKTSALGAVGAVGETGVGIYSAIFAGIVATASCISCLAGLVGFLSAGSVFFILNNTNYFIGGAIAIVLASLLFTAKRVMNQCTTCK